MKSACFRPRTFCILRYKASFLAAHSLFKGKKGVVASMYLRVVVNCLPVIVCLTCPGLMVYAAGTCSPSVTVERDLYKRLESSPATLVRDMTKQTDSGHIQNADVFSALIDAIRKENGIPGNHKEVSRLIKSICPENTAFLINSLSFEIGPGHAYTNLIIAQLLLNREMSTQQRDQLCRAVSTVYVDSGADNHRSVVAPMSPTQMAADGIEILADLGRLSEGSIRALLKVLRANHRTNEGRWLATFLYRHMPTEVAIQNLDIIVDILEEPPQDGSVQYEFDRGVYARVPGVFILPHPLLKASEISHGDDSLLQPEERNFLAWCNETCAITWPRTTADAMRLLIIRTGAPGLPTLLERIADPSKDQQRRLRLLACAAQIAPDSHRVKRYLLEVIRTSKNPDWMLASEVARNIEMSEEYSANLQIVWKKWHNHNRYRDESTYRFLFAIGAWQEGMRLLNASLPTIEKMGASPPFYMLFLEDVPYAPERYERVLVRLLNGKIWWHRCAAIVMLFRYTDYFKNRPQLFEAIMEDDQEPLVRAVCRQIQRTKKEPKKVTNQKR